MWFFESLMILTIILNMIMILIGIAFNTLLERKVLGYIQDRKGPNKVMFNGFMQPFSDAIKLYSNEITYVNKSMKFYFFFTPMLMLMLMLMIWSVVPLLSESLLTHNELLFIFCCLAFSSYPLMMSGWSSYSNYSLIGTIRVVSQMISYEVVMILIMLMVILFNEGFSLIDFFFFQEINKYLFMLSMVMVIFYISILAELNRSPFDLIEGESELVSGFNVEYSSGLFGLIFMAEYGMIMFSSFLITFMFLGLKMYKLYFYLSFMFFNFSIIWLRGVLPRIRYDELMMLCWKHILLMVLIFFYYNLIMKMMIEFLFF